MTSPQSPSARAERATEAHLTQFSDSDMAYHEAGHAVIHHLNGGTINRLSIDRADPRRGTQPAKQRPPATGDDPKAKLENMVAVLVAGDVSGTLHGTPEPLVTVGSRVDHEQALRAAAEVGIPVDQARAMIDTAWERVRDRLREPANWQLVEALAKELLQHRTLEAEPIKTILAR